VSLVDRLFLREAQRGDASGIVEVHEAASPGSGDAALYRQLRGEGDLLHSIVAVEGRNVRGHAAFSRALLAGTPVVVVGPVAVVPDLQRRGIGTAMMEQGISSCRADDEVAIFLLGDPAFYGRLGFSAAVAASFESPYAGPGFQALVLRTELLPACGALEYPAPFASLP
jgi:putative acetyltransferase